MLVVKVFFPLGERGEGREGRGGGRGGRGRRGRSGNKEVIRRFLFEHLFLKRHEGGQTKNKKKTNPAIR